MVPPAAEEAPPKPSAASSWRERRRALRRKREAEEGDIETGGAGDDGLALLGGGGIGGGSGGASYTSAAKRARMEREAVLLGAGAEAAGGDGGPSSSSSSSLPGRIREARARKALAALGAGAPRQDQDQRERKRREEDGTVEGWPAKKEEAAGEGGEGGAGSDGENDGGGAVTSLLEQAEALKEKRDLLSEAERNALDKKGDEDRILREASQVQTNALQAASELAQGVEYRDSFRTSWRCPRKLLAQGEGAWDAVRDKWHILVEGDDIPPPIQSFRDMKFPAPILDALAAKNIRRPTPIQMQGLPVALAGRDMVGIAFTGSGKTMTFALPLVMAALEEEARMPLEGGEGPVGIILAPSRELVRQTYEAVQAFCDALAGPGPGGAPSAHPRIRAQLIIGGESARDQLDPIREHGVHCVVASPGRLRDFLKKKSINLDVCRYICLDEADRMLDLGFDEEVGEIMNHFTRQRQTLLFSATFPKKFQDFAKSTLVRPVVVNVGRAGAANLDVIQEVEYVKQEAKIVYLLECLQKTAPPAMIFCERKGDVDDIHEYLLLKGVEAVSIHGGKDQEERNEAIALFKDGTKDVLVATDIAAKGLDFPDIQHVINFDMPTEIENYVHRIGRTGRCGKTGVATTFINKGCEETTLLDLKHLLKEARQRIPPVLMIMDDPVEEAAARDGAAGGGGAAKGCSFCGGLGHTIVDCPKIDKDARRVAGGHKDALASGDGYGGDW